MLYLTITTKISTISMIALKRKFAALLCFAVASMIILHLIVNDDKRLTALQTHLDVKRQADKLFTSTNPTEDPYNVIDDALQGILVDDSKEDNSLSDTTDKPFDHEPTDRPKGDDGNKENTIKEVQRDIEKDYSTKDDDSHAYLIQRDTIQEQRDKAKLLRDNVQPWRDKRRYKMDHSHAYLIRRDTIQEMRDKAKLLRDKVQPWRDKRRYKIDHSHAYLIRRDTIQEKRDKAKLLRDKVQPWRDKRRYKTLTKRDIQLSQSLSKNYKVNSRRDKEVTQDNEEKQRRDKVISRRDKIPPRHHSKPLQSVPKINKKTALPKASSAKKMNKRQRNHQSKSRKIHHRKSHAASRGSNITALNFNCPYEGLGTDLEELKSNMDGVTCIPYPRTKEICDKAYEYMEPQESHPIQCDHHSTDGPICAIKTLYRYSINDKVDIECNPDNCDEEILVGCVDIQYGIVPREEHWKTYDSVESLEANLPKIIKENSINGFNFCFLKCGVDDKNHQPLIFPPVIKRRKSPKEPAGLNVNILLEDAVSRSHFYRSLPRTVATLRQLAKNTESGVKVLDFELMQSYAAFTLKNVRNLFNGRMKLEEKTGRESGMNIMMKSFQQMGYQTLIQEDLCFFDTWGSILSENYNRKLEPFSQKFKAFYQKHWNMTSEYIDNRGLTSLACESLRTRGYTNPFAHPNKLCLNGKFISNYMMKYVEDLLRGVDGRKDIAPSIIYTHLNTGHENSGERIRTDDVPLAEHIKTMSKLSNTITIILSDHGSKTTEYSITNFYGRLEVFSPMMFMIIPQKAAELLGKTSMENLVRNQKKLVALIDLHRMLQNLIKSPRPAVHDYRVSGLLAPVLANRTCSDIEGLTSDAYCRCKGWNHFVGTQHHTTRWLAEVALGEINNRITKQFTEGRPEVKTTSLGYGACSRFIGQSIEQARQTFEGDYVITTLLFTVVPVYGSKSTERFQVRLNHSSVDEPNVRVINIIRVSVYGKYESCADKSVDVKLCACAPETTGDNARMNIRDLLSQTHFGLKTSVRTLPLSRCLLFGERTLKKMTIRKMQTRIGGFEIANKCNNKSFKLQLAGKSKKSSISRKLPFTLTIQPRSVVFLFAVDNAWKYGRFKPLVKLVEDSSENEDDDDITKQDNEADFN